jgi:hypothetical protein
VNNNHNQGFLLHRFTRASLTTAVLACAIVLNGCYSFTGSSVPAHIKSIAIPLFDDQSGFGEAGVRDRLSQKLIQEFTSDNNLEIRDKTNADSIIEGAITAIRDEPAVITSKEQTTSRRITITVHAVYTDFKLRKKVWERDFSQMGEYNAGEVRTTAIDLALTKISEDILIETVSGW